MQSHQTFPEKQPMGSPLVKDHLRENYNLHTCMRVAVLLFVSVEIKIGAVLIVLTFVRVTKF